MGKGQLYLLQQELYPYTIIVARNTYLLQLGEGQKFGGNPFSESLRESENPFSQRFSSTKLRESKWILVNIQVYHSNSYGKNPWILAKFHWKNPNGFSLWVTNPDPVQTVVAPEGAWGQS